MEKEPHQEYRDNLAKELNETRKNTELEDPIAEARGKMEKAQNTEDYQKAREVHQSEIAKQTDDFSAEEDCSNSNYEKVLQVFMEGDFELLDPNHLVSKNEAEAEFNNNERKSDSSIVNLLRGDLEGALQEVPRPGNYYPSVEKIKKLCERFRGKILVDIGAGSSIDGYEVARVLGASGYIAVEPYYAKNLLYKFQHNDTFLTDKERTIPFVVIKEKGSEALKKLKDGSVNVMSVATDEYILEQGEATEIGEEVQRVIGEKGVFLNFDSIISTPDLQILGRIEREPWSVFLGK